MPGTRPGMTNSEGASMEKLSQLIKGPDLIVAPCALNPIMAQMAALAGFKAAYLSGGSLGWYKGVTEAGLSLTEMIQVVVDIRTVTMGGVIGAGQPLMDIVPVDDELIVEGRVAPGDIDSVREGQPTQVRLTAYKRTIAPLIDGRLTYVSADMLTDPKTQDRYFLVRIRLDKESLDSQGNIRLTTGMLAEVMIVTGERRAIDYLVAPFAERLRRSMREE